MSGKPRGSEPKRNVSVTMDAQLYDFVMQEPNRSAFIENLLKNHYSKTIEQIKQEKEEKAQLEKRNNTTVCCMECNQRSTVPEYENAGWKCPKCKSARFVDYLTKKYGGSNAVG
jgi:ribosomal protein L37AE/L43A